MSPELAMVVGDSVLTLGLGFGVGWYSADNKRLRRRNEILTQVTALSHACPACGGAWTNWSKPKKVYDSAIDMYRYRQVRACQECGLADDRFTATEV